MVVRKMKRRVKKAGLTLIGTTASLISPAFVSASHIIDERPGLGTGMTIILSVFWIAVVIGIIILVRRLMRPRHTAHDYQAKEITPEEKKEKSIDKD